jgi:mRNA interferase RelE/StbE
MSYDLSLGRQAKKEIKALDTSTIKRIVDRFQQLSLNPFDPRISKAIKMSPGRRTSRVGDWRIIYEIHESQKVIEVVSIRARREAY